MNQNSSPKISVIVPVYKVEKYLRACIDSILAQTFTDFELILVDDGSPDNCGAICDEYRSRDERIIVIHKENGGVVEARIFGLKKAIGDYVIFIDADDKWTRSALDGLWAGTKNGSIDFVRGGLMYEDFDGKITKILVPAFLGEYTVENLVKKPIKTLFDITGMCVCGGLFSRKSVLAGAAVIENYKINVFEDGLFAVAILLNSKTAYFARDPFYYYVMREGSATHCYNPKTVPAGEGCCEAMKNLLEHSALFSRERIDEIVSEHAGTFLIYAFMMQVNAPSRRERFSQLRKLRWSQFYKYAQNRRAKSFRFRVVLALLTNDLLSEVFFTLKEIFAPISRVFKRVSCGGGGKKN